MIFRTVVLGAMLAGALLAQAPTTKQQKAEELLTLTNTEATLGRSMNLVREQMKSGFFTQLTGSTKLTADQKKTVDEFEDKMMGILSGVLSYDKLKPQLIDLYANSFTDQELDGAIAFYKSDAGKAIIAKTPALMTQAMNITQTRMQDASGQIQELMKEYTEKLKQSQNQQW